MVTSQAFVGCRSFVSQAEVFVVALLDHVVFSPFVVEQSRGELINVVAERRPARGRNITPRGLFDQAICFSEEVGVFAEHPTGLRSETWKPGERLFDEAAGLLLAEVLGEMIAERREGRGDPLAAGRWLRLAVCQGAFPGAALFLLRLLGSLGRRFNRLPDRPQQRVEFMMLVEDVAENHGVGTVE